jgi:hypothetical protein
MQYMAKPSSFIRVSGSVSCLGLQFHPDLPPAEKAMNVRTIGLMITVVFIAYAAFRLWKAFNLPEGERYLKCRMQGPFVPLTPKEQNREK